MGININNNTYAPRDLVNGALDEFIAYLRCYCVSRRRYCVSRRSLLRLLRMLLYSQRACAILRSLATTVPESQQILQDFLHVHWSLHYRSGLLYGTDGGCMHLSGAQAPALGAVMSCHGARCKHLQFRREYSGTCTNRKLFIYIPTSNVHPLC